MNDQIPAGDSGLSKENIRGFWNSPFVEIISKMVSRVLHGDVEASESVTETQTDRDQVDTGQIQVGRISAHFTMVSDRSTSSQAERNLTVTGADSEDEQGEGGSKRKTRFFRKGTDF